MPDVDQKLIDNFSFLISIVVPILLKNVLTFLFGGQIGTGPFFKDIGGKGIALTMLDLTLINFFNSDDGRRLFGIISAGGSLGAFFGTSVTQYFALEVCGSDITDTGPIFLIIFSIICLCISIFLARDLHVEDSDNFSEREEIGGSAGDAIKSLISVPEVRNIALYVLLFTTLATIAWMMSLDIIREWSSDPCERTSYFSFVEQVVIPLTLIMQVLFSSFLISSN